VDNDGIQNSDEENANFEIQNSDKEEKESSDSNKETNSPFLQALPPMA